MTRARIEPLDGVRGAAALMLLFFHFWQHGGAKAFPFFNRAAGFGQTGVDLFLVLSGFLITRILLDARGSSRYFPSFYARRVLRIFPLYYLFLAVYYLLAPSWTGRPAPGFEQAKWHLFYLQNTPWAMPQAAVTGPLHFWSLAVEEHFYLAWPFLVWLVPPKRLPWLIGFVVAACGVYRVNFGQWGGASLFTLYRMDALALGAWLATIEFSGKWDRWKKFFPLVFTGAGATAVFLWSFRASWGAPWTLEVKFLSLGLLYWALVGMVAASPGSAAARIFGARWLLFTGKISYGLYVWHPLCFELLRKKWPESAFTLPGLAASFAAAYLAAWISWRLFEAPILSLKRFFPYERTASASISTKS